LDHEPRYPVSPMKKCLIVAINIISAQGLRACQSIVEKSSVTIPRLITLKRHADARGWFLESYNRRSMEGYGIDADFCQDNHSMSVAKGTIRGLHFQKPPFAQAKLVRCLAGSIFDLAVDIRVGSPTFGKSMTCTLSADSDEQFFVPQGFAHGFLTLQDGCEVAYKVDNYYAADADSGICWNDPMLAIDWPLDGLSPILSDKDAALPRLCEHPEYFRFDPLTMQPLAA
jgi:dTDP-4-dehydrorhamnose 3,5-epimerase